MFRLLRSGTRARVSFGRRDVRRNKAYTTKERTGPRHLVRSNSRVRGGSAGAVARLALPRQGHAFLVHDGLVDLRRVGRLHLYLDAVQLSLEVLLRGRVHHLLSDRRVVGDPATGSSASDPGTPRRHPRTGGPGGRARTMRRRPPCSYGSGPPSRTRSRTAHTAGCPRGARRRTRRSRPARASAAASARRAMHTAGQPPRGAIPGGRGAARARAHVRPSPRTDPP